MIKSAHAGRAGLTPDKTSSTLRYRTKPTSKQRETNKHGHCPKLPAKTKQTALVKNHGRWLYLARVTLVFLDSRVVYNTDVVVDVKMEQRAGFSPSLGDNQIIERVMLRNTRDAVE